MAVQYVKTSVLSFRQFYGDVQAFPLTKTQALLCHHLSFKK